MQRSGGSGETDCFLSVWSVSLQPLSRQTRTKYCSCSRQAFSEGFCQFVQRALTNTRPDRHEMWTHTGKTHRNRDEHLQKTHSIWSDSLWMWIMNKLKKTALQHISCYFMLCINGYINRHINTEGYIHTYDYTETHKGNAVVMVRHLLLCSGSSFWLATCTEELQCMEWKMRWIIRFN